MPTATVQEFTTDEEARTALEQGRVDAYVIDATMQMSSIVKNPGKYRLAGDSFGPEDPYGIGLQPDLTGHLRKHLAGKDHGRGTKLL